MTLEIMNHFSLASFSRNPMIILLLQTMTFSKEAYQTLEINNKRVSFSCLKGKKKPAERENVCESTKMFILGWAAVCFRYKEQHVCRCVTGGLLPQDSWAVSLERPCGGNTQALHPVTLETNVLLMTGRGSFSLLICEQVN